MRFGNLFDKFKRPRIKRELRASLAAGQAA
jgi:hypothetical protein